MDNNSDTKATNRTLIIVAILAMLAPIIPAFLTNYDKFFPKNNLPKISDSLQNHSITKYKNLPFVKSSSKSSKKHFLLTIVFNTSEIIKINGEVMNCNGNIIKTNIIEGNKYEILIGNCSPIKLIAQKDEELTSCN